MNRKTGVFLYAVLLSAAVLYFVTGDMLRAGDADDKTVDIGGAFLGVFNYLNQSNRPDNSEKRQQFDFAGNIDLQWNIGKNMRAVMQLQGGTGEGSLGYAGSSLVITDLNLEIDVSSSFTFTVGSFDTPFGADTPCLSNNADIRMNPLILNSLFYSALADTNVGTLNTLGIKGEYEGRFGDFSVAVTNGTGESSLNGDGNFEWVVYVRTRPFFKWLSLAGSYMKSNDRSISGETGSGSRFKAWMVDAIFHLGPGIEVKAYYGEVTYGDEIPTSDDDVTVWKAETRLRFNTENFFLAARASGWEPDEFNGNLLIPNPGFALDIDSGASWFYRAHKIQRYQLGAGWFIKKNVLLKAEWFYDNYDSEPFVKPDTQGLIMVLNVLL